MGKNILIVTGSPRANGNSNTLAEAFAKGAEASGNTVQTMNACSLNLDGCHGDGSCHERGFCGLKDDGVKLHESLCWADVLVLSTPIYWKSFSAQIKAVVDRLYPYAAPAGRGLIRVKESYLIASANNPDPAVFNPIKEEFALVNNLLKFECKGQLLAGGLGGPEAVKEHPEYIEAAIKMGAAAGSACCQAASEGVYEGRNKIGLLFFYIPGCKYCSMADSILQELQNSNPDYARVEILKIDEQARPDIAAKFTHNRVPAFFLGDNRIYQADPADDRAKMKIMLEKMLQATLEVNRSVADLF